MRRAVHPALRTSPPTPTEPPHLGGLARPLPQQRAPDEEGPTTVPHPQVQLLQKIRQCAVPVIAAVEGGVWGGACDIVACCDVVVGTPEVTFAITPAKVRRGGLPRPPSTSRGLLPRPSATSLDLPRPPSISLDLPRSPAPRLGRPALPRERPHALPRGAAAARDQVDVLLLHAALRRGGGALRLPQRVRPSHTPPTHLRRTPPRVRPSVGACPPTSSPPRCPKWRRSSPRAYAGTGIEP